MTGLLSTAALLVTVIGTVAGLGGHWLFAYKHHVFRSAIARRIFQQKLLGPRRTRPTHQTTI